jgi:Ca2+-binding RTX toxin-like protein
VISRTHASAVGLVCGVLLGVDTSTAGADVTVSSFQGIQVVSNEEADRIRLERSPPDDRDPDKFQVTREFLDADTTITAGGGCVQHNASQVRCTTALHRVNVTLGGGNDTLFSRGFDQDRFELTATGGEGDDFFFTQFAVGTSNLPVVAASVQGRWTFDGGPGDDRIDASGSPDLVEDDPPDVWRGGTGNDSLTYEMRTAGVDPATDMGVNVSLDGVANDGQPGEGDNVASDIEKVTGTRRADVLTGTTGSARCDYLLGRGGDDQLRGLAGDDALVGDQEGDLIEGGTGDDFIEGYRREPANPCAPDFDPGSFNATSSTVTNDEDVLLGGPGADDLFGGPNVDRYSGGEGRDRLFTRDALAEQIDCGEDLRTVTSFDSFDLLVSDLLDPRPPNCETIDHGELREGPNVRLRLLSRSAAAKGTARVRIGCPRRVRRRCAGRVRARVVNSRGRSLAGATPAERYKIRRGAAGKETLALSSAARRALTRGSGRYLRLEAVTRGRFGKPMTAVATVAVRR